jgi:hypothetical protein
VRTRDPVVLPATASTCTSQLVGSAVQHLRELPPEANSDVGRAGTFSGVTHWVEFLRPLYEEVKASLST